MRPSGGRAAVSSQLTPITTAPLRGKASADAWESASADGFPP